MAGDLRDLDELLDPDVPSREQPNDEKFRELIVHIALMSQDDPYWGATKLNKLLFYSDFLAYVNFGRSITGQEYQAIKRGPAPRYLLPVRQQMEERGDVATQETRMYRHVQKRTVALRDPDLSGFRAEEIALVDRLIKDWWGASAADMSRRTHDLILWNMVEEGETIPYELALLDNSDEPTDEELAYARTLVPLAEKYLTA